MKQYTNLFFDLDRTLWDFEANSKETLMEMYNAFHLKLYTSDFYTFYRAFIEVNDDLWLKYRNKQISKEELRWQRFYLTLKPFHCEDKQLANKLDEYYVRESPLKSKMFPNTIETLKMISPEYKKFILTNGFSEVQYIKLKTCGLDSFFEKVYTSEQVGVQKPGREFFEFVLADLNTKPDKCLMIGDDTISDIEGAKNVGIDQVFFNPQKYNTDCDPTFEISNLSQLLEIL